MRCRLCIIFRSFEEWRARNLRSKHRMKGVYNGTHVSDVCICLILSMCLSLYHSLSQLSLSRYAL